MSYIAVESITNEEEKEKVEAVFAKLNAVNKRNFWVRKRIISFTLSLILIIFTLIPMGIIALAIFISDGHNPVFAQDRVGRFGRVFKMYKFRTMVPNADKMKDELSDKNEMDGPAFKIKDDPRITKLGKFLRKTSLDELPQFFNVLRGDMTIIGPRPPLPSEVAQYTEYQKIRLVVTPGITCIWQVRPNRNSIPFDEWVNMDIDYVLHRSFKLDLKISCMTVRAMVRGQGS